jgi:Asp-tRNA(Asn)/Glu-tRNA(Gln) amidotransferase A subunit family amidase
MRARAASLFDAFAVKDNIDVRTSDDAACPAFARPPRSAAIVELRARSAVCLGKPISTSLQPGWSARVPRMVPCRTFEASAHLRRIGQRLGRRGRRQVAFALGTDTAGSGRVPAGFNTIGLTGAV